MLSLGFIASGYRDQGCGLPEMDSDSSSNLFDKGGTAAKRLQASRSECGTGA
jgi:hypothetical protein